jgi:hypothetical protein
MKQKLTTNIFLVGCPRSGTTLLQSLLAAHSDILSFPETKFFMYLIPEYEPRRKFFGIIPRRLKTVVKDFLDKIERAEKIKQFSQRIFIKQYVKQFIKILDELTFAQGKSIWLEKTPGHVQKISVIKKYVPDAKFIHIVRNGSDVVASLYEVTQKYPKVWRGPWDIDTCIDRWINDIEITRRYINQPNHTLVRYEDLVANPEKVLRKLCEFIGVEFSETMLEDYRDVAKQLIRDREKWKAPVSGKIQSTNSQKFYQVFDEAQQQYILDRLSSVNLDWSFDQ